MTGGFILNQPPPTSVQNPYPTNPNKASKAEEPGSRVLSHCLCLQVQVEPDKTMIIKLHYTCTTVRVIGLLKFCLDIFPSVF